MHEGSTRESGRENSEFSRAERSRDPGVEGGGDEFVANLLSFIVSIPREMQDGKGKRINFDPLPLVM